MKDKLEEFIKQNRKICWESEYQNGEYCIGENKVRQFFDSSQLEPPVKQMLAKEPFTLIDILETLNKATNILLHEKDYDGNDYEQMEYCLRRSQLIVESGNVTIKI